MRILFHRRLISCSTTAPIISGKEKIRKVWWTYLKWGRARDESGQMLLTLGIKKVAAPDRFQAASHNRTGNSSAHTTCPHVITSGIEHTKPIGIELNDSVTSQVYFRSSQRTKNNLRHSGLSSNYHPRSPCTNSRSILFAPMSDISRLPSCSMTPGCNR